MTLDLLTEIYSAFEPFQPPSKEVYVECRDVRGGWEIILELGQISQFAKITANLKATPDKRREIRRKINANTPSLVAALNDFIKAAQKTLPEDSRGIVIIADNLDRIAETQEAGKPSNYDEIYLNRSEMLRGLACHVIYTVPIAMIYSDGRATQLENNYDTPDVLPMVMVRNRDGSENVAGIDKLQELVSRRVAAIDPHLAKTLTGTISGIDAPAVFDSSNSHFKTLVLQIMV